MSSPSLAYVVIPCRNEGAVIGSVLAELCRYPYRVVVVDDGSTDDSVAQAARFPVVVLRHAYNLGQGAALQTGLSYALLRPDVAQVVTFDADGQHHPGDIARLLMPLEGGACDVALGTRFHPARKPVGMPPARRLLLQAALRITRVTTGLRVTDTHNGLRAFTAAAARRIRISRNHMAHASEILSQISRLGLRYIEVPVTVRYTPYSLSKGQPLSNSVNILWDTLTEKLP